MESSNTFLCLTSFCLNSFISVTGNKSRIIPSLHRGARFYHAILLPSVSKKMAERCAAGRSCQQPIFLPYFFLPSLLFSACEKNRHKCRALWNPGPRLNPFSPTRRRRVCLGGCGRRSRVGKGRRIARHTARQCRFWRRRVSREKS
jgi:hypothetical protein